MTGFAVTTEILVIGFGPVGAAVAGLLGRRGIRVVVLERDRDVFPLPRAAHVDHTGLRVWQEMGLLDLLRPDMLVNEGLDFVSADGDLLTRIPASASSRSGWPASMYFHQPIVDQTARRVVSSLPAVRTELGVHVTGLDSDGERVRVHTADDRGQARTFEASWVVACDGAASSVRSQCGIDQEDLGFEEPWLVVDVILTDALSRRMPHRAICSTDPDRPTFSIPMPRGRHRFEFRITATEAVDGAERGNFIRALVAKWVPSSDYVIERSAVYTFHGLVASRWSDGRVLLAGDAAHQMPPFLGQGMCSGLRDAANLAWKLHGVLRRGAPTSLLNSYGGERRPHVRSIVESAVRIGRVLGTLDRDIVRHGDVEHAPRMHPPQGLSFTMPPLLPGPLVLEGGGELFPQPLGPEAQGLDDVIGQRFAIVARDHRDLDVGAVRWWSQNQGACLATAATLPSWAASPVRRWLDDNDAACALIRPDRYVLWAGIDLARPTHLVASLLGGRHK